MTYGVTFRRKGEYGRCRKQWNRLELRAGLLEEGEVFDTIDDIPGPRSIRVAPRLYIAAVALADLYLDYGPYTSAHVQLLWPNGNRDNVKAPEHGGEMTLGGLVYNLSKDGQIVVARADRHEGQTASENSHTLVFYILSANSKLPMVRSRMALVHKEVDDKWRLREIDVSRLRDSS